MYLPLHTILAIVLVLLKEVWRKIRAPRLKEEPRWWCDDEDGDVGDEGEEGEEGEEGDEGDELLDALEDKEGVLFL